MAESNVIELKKPPLAERLAQNADGILEQIARDYSVSTFDVVRALPAEHRTVVAGSLFEKIFAELTGWGEVLFIVHTPDMPLYDDSAKVGLGLWRHVALSFPLEIAVLAVGAWFYARGVRFRGAGGRVLFWGWIGYEVLRMSLH